GIEARMYALGTALAAHGNWLLLRWAHFGPTTRSWAGYVLVSTLFLYTHYYALFLVLAQFVFLGALAACQASRGMRLPAAALRRTTLAAGAVITFLYLPWCWPLLQQVQRVGQSYWIPPLSWQAALATLGEFIVPHYSGWSDAGLVLLFALALLALLALAWKPGYGEGLGLGTASLPLLLAAAVLLLVPLSM